MKSIKFAIKTFGCKVNQYESQVIRENLAKIGCLETTSGKASVVIINSCTVTGMADTKALRFIKKVKKENPGAKIMVTGCSVVYPKDIAVFESMPGVDRVVPNGEKFTLPLIVSDLYGICDDVPVVREEISGFDSHTRAFLKIQDGCDQKCSYCKVSLVRGPSRSRPKQDILNELTRLLKGNYKEIVLTGICLGSWKGSNKEALPDLLKEIDSINGDFRLRMSSIEPNHITGDLLRTMARSTRICRHLHIPLQSGSDKILALMKRRYNISRFRKLINDIRSELPLAGITMDVIAGFPGETEEDFLRTIELIKEVQASRLHVFGYSDRKGTASFDMTPKIERDIAKKRVSSLIGIGRELMEKFSKRFVGQNIEILVEARTKNDQLTGYTREYVQVTLPGYLGIPGELVRAKPTAIDKISHCLSV
ncbi:MAG: tRNA (N(6)-L-threonylcarbamoyladenosine(37)-C(2))-methylthiotransferase MtaB [Candidatus Omnitrophica bacterium]|nr:tRNA (N(6)-L-threonylcarbamoyladenosine(37)-C(2))-methylthiotransferase MtaB [Candidatus Omnitrophota bacterium]MBU1127489.1 tRNA (N(6)-L-threonylcarbamoyladenosine(37)-C(2))-methylthiotransferase MtaB [Candidatus Omnitrophota bacterium]MBU1851506.1 tRNA (N(6)-L-threonylcarbamoyladenosine(37)-C(2))-methylthiotransferase MtaB [Candidatus Omnitrophota bacterium]